MSDTTDLTLNSNVECLIFIDTFRETFLEETSCQLETAADGAEALRKFRSGGFDLVLMDIQMPVMDGHEATRRIRSLESEKGWKPTPILALTAHAMVGDEQQSLSAGCDGHITKPVTREKLLTVIGQFMKNKDGPTLGRVDIR